MRTLRNNLGLLAFIGLAGLLELVFRHELDPYYYKILVDVGIAVTLAVSLNLINGITGQFSLGHAGFMGIGAYVAASLSTLGIVPALARAGCPPALEGLVLALSVGVAVVVGGVCAALAGLAVGVPTLRLKGDYLAIATLGFGEIIRTIILNTEAVGGPRGMSGIQPLSSFFWVWAWAGICVVVIWRLAHSVKGRAFYAIREDEFAAAATGVDTTRYKVIAFVLGSFFAGVAGGLLAHSATGYINPSQFDTLKSIEIVVMVVLGGLGSISGTVIAAVVLTVLPEALRGFADYRMVAYSLLLILIMLTRPRGLMGAREAFHVWKRLPQ
ncbi:MAG: branched-chain amino acid ABC transporter permease [Verrucomicrobiae bacterium]|nr:branched-chain amino acid ABC transporter permease [Verrucomicrobiae bacterium]